MVAYRGCVATIGAVASVVRAVIAVRHYRGHR
jgi:hypothetical protein